jgi:hypothetical protein
MPLGVRRAKTRRRSFNPQRSTCGRTACHSQQINIPTGLGKTAAVVLAWLFNRLSKPVQVTNA